MQRCEGVEGLLRSKSVIESSDVFLWKVLYRKLRGDDNRLGGDGGRCKEEKWIG